MINAPVVGAAVTPTGNGYWLAAGDGGVFAFGDAPYLGGLPGRDRIVGIAASPRGDGYWLVGADGGVFAFGAARYLGGLGGRSLSAGITGMAPTPDGRGYWLSGADGAVYAFGSAEFMGGLSGQQVGGPIVAMAPTTDGRGYWLAGRDGGIYSFGDAPFLGGLVGRPHAAVVGLASVHRGTDGYWIATADGGLFTFGSAGYYGSVGASQLNGPIVGVASGDGVAIPGTPASPTSPHGFDISWPQCGQVHPAPPYGFGVVGVTAGHVFSVNPCLEEQWVWARTYGSFAALYVNTNAPTAAEWADFSATVAAGCGPNAGCLLTLWGQRAADGALAAAARIQAPMWWLDVETNNVWLPDTAANAVIIGAMVGELQKAGKRVGVYSTASQWSDIAGSFAPGLPLWIPGAPTDDIESYCVGHMFGGGIAWMAQSQRGGFDSDYLCTGGLRAYSTAFAPPAPVPAPDYSVPRTLSPPCDVPTTTTPAPVPEPVPHRLAAAPLLPARGSTRWPIAVLGAIELGALTLLTRRVRRWLTTGGLPRAPR